MRAWIVAPWSGGRRSIETRSLRILYCRNCDPLYFRVRNGRNRDVWQKDAIQPREKVTNVGFCLGLPTESNKWYSVVGVSGPILKSTTDITWGPGDRVSHPVRGRPGLWGDTAKRGRRMMFNHKGGPYSTRNSNLLSLITCVRILSHPQWRGRPQ